MHMCATQRRADRRKILGADGKMWTRLSTLTYMYSLLHTYSKWDYENIWSLGMSKIPLQFFLLFFFFILQYLDSYFCCTWTTDWMIHLWKYPPAEKTWDAFMVLSERKCIFSRRHGQSNVNMAEFNMFVYYILVLNREHWSWCQFVLLTSWQHSQHCWPLGVAENNTGKGGTPWHQAFFFLFNLLSVVQKLESIFSASFPHQIKTHTGGTQKGEDN